MNKFNIGMVLFVCLVCTSTPYGQSINKKATMHAEPDITMQINNDSDVDTLFKIFLNNDDVNEKRYAVKLLGMAFDKGIEINQKNIGGLHHAWNKETDEGIKADILTLLWRISGRNKDSRIADIAVQIIKTPELELYKTRALQIIENFGGDNRVKNELFDIIQKDPYTISKVKYRDFIDLQNTEPFTLGAERLRTAVICLARMKCKEAIPIFLNKMLGLLRDSENDLFKKYASSGPDDFSPPTMGDDLIGIYASGLNFMGGEEVISALKPLLTDENKRVNYQGAKMLGNYGDTTVVPVLCEFLWVSKIPGERLYIVKTLGSLGNKRAIPTLKKALLEKDNNILFDQGYKSDIRYEAYRALQKMGVKVERIGRNEFKVVE